ncbi:ATP-dependent DNA ligase, partial [Patescibacteria group bacterium]
SQEVDKVCYLSLGRLAPLYAGIEFNLAEKLMIRALALAYQQEESQVRGKYKELGDLGDVAANYNAQAKAKAFSVSQVHQRLKLIADESGTGSVDRKIIGMASLLGDLTAREARYAVRILLGRLRLGFLDKTILDALSWLLGGDKSKRDVIEAAYNVQADVGQVAGLIKSKGLKGLRGLKVKLGVPIVPALCQRLPTTEKIVEKMSQDKDSLGSGQNQPLIAVEPKYDGTRLQIHFSRKKKSLLIDDQLSFGFQPKVFVQIFTRNLENVTHMFPDLVKALSDEVKAEEVILDGEAIGFDPKTGKLLAFQETIKRKRKHQVSQTAKEIPLRYYGFDLLFCDGQGLLEKSFKDRRTRLEKVLPKKNKLIVCSPQMITNDPQKIRLYHEQEVAKGLEGVVAKKWLSPYDPGKRGFTWVKLKQEKGKKGAGLADTLDCLVMGYYSGKGKRVKFGIGMFLVGIRVGKQFKRLKHFERLGPEDFLTVSKVGTGLTDDQWREMKERSRKYEVRSQPKEYRVDKNMFPDVWLRPGIVVEIEADNITKSPIHTAGFAMRFPRLVRFRDDKSPGQTTTLKEVEELYGLQK